MRVKFLIASILLLAQASWVRADPYARLAKDLTKNVRGISGKRVAIVPFQDTNGRPLAGGNAVAVFLETQMAKHGDLKIVNRSLLGKVLEELKLQHAGLVSPKSALKIGHFAGAELLVTGIVSGIGTDRVEVHARLILIETGVVLRAVKTRVPTRWFAPVWSQTASRSLPILHTLKLKVGRAGVIGAVRRIGVRDISFRYAYPGRNKLAIRMTDFTGSGPARWKEIVLPNRPDGLGCRRFAKNLRLSGRRYRMWLDANCNLHVAPRGGLLSGIFLDGVVKEDETVVSHRALAQSWRDDIKDHSQDFRFPNGDIVKACVEPLQGSKVRVSLFSRGPLLGTESNIVPEPSDVAILRGRRGRVVRSGLLRSGNKFFRFYYSLDSQDLHVELIEDEGDLWPAQEPSVGGRVWISGR